MTQIRFEMILTGMAVVTGSGLWIYAWTLSGPTGRRVLSFGLDRPLRALGADLKGRFVPEGAHERTRTREVPIYDGEPVRMRVRDEAQRVAEYAALREEAQAVASVSAAPLVDFTGELRRLMDEEAPAAVPPDLAALQEVVRLHEELAAVEASYAQRIAAAIRRAHPSEATQEYRLVAV